MSSSKNIFRLTQTLCKATIRNSSSDSVPSPRFAKMKAAQKIFGVEDGIPVHLKNGFGDRILYVGTWVLTSLATAGGLHVFYRIVFKE